MSDSDKGRVSRNIGGDETPERSAPARESLVDTQADRLRHGVGRDQRVETPSWERDPDGGVGGPRRRGWAAVAALVGLGAVVGTVMWLLRDDGNRPVTGSEIPVRPVEESGPPAKVSGHTAREVAEAFLGATSQEERMAWVRERPGLLERVATFPAEVTALPVVVEQLAPMPKMRTAEGLEYVQFAARMGGGEMRLLCVVATEAGFRVDWESLARYSSAGWEELNHGQVEEAEVRAFVRPVDYYLHGYPDDRRWQSFSLTSPDWPEALYGYAQRGTTTAKLLERVASKAVPAARVTLRVKSGPEAGRKQIEVMKVLAAGWVVGDRDLEAAFEKLQEPPAE